MPQYITGDDEWPGLAPTAYAPSRREEAVICDADLGDAWRGHAGRDPLAPRAGPVAPVGEAS